MLALRMTAPAKEMSTASFLLLEAQPLAAPLPTKTQKAEIPRLRLATRLHHRRLGNRLRLLQWRCRGSQRIRHFRDRAGLRSRTTAFRRRLSKPSHVLLPLARLMGRHHALGYLHGVDESLIDHVDRCIGALRRVGSDQSRLRRAGRSRSIRETSGHTATASLKF